MQYAGEPWDEFRRTFNDWDNIEYLEGFFETHKSQLGKSIYAPITVEEAVLRTVAEASLFEKHVLEAAENPSRENTLELVFQPLHKQLFSNTYTESKAYGVGQRSWLRVYGIRVADGLYVVSGSGIKLTKSMQEAEHLKLELRKLEATRDYLKANGITDSDDLGFFEIENI